MPTYRIVLYPLLTLLLSLSVSLGAVGQGTGSDSKRPVSKTLKEGTSKGISAISPGQCVSGELAPGDEEFEDFTFFDEYTLVWPGGGLEITLDSAQFNEFLIVLDPSGAQRNVNNSSTAPEVFFLVNGAAGTYGIRANSLTREMGSYELCVGDPVATTAISPGQCVSGELAPGDDQVPDPDNSFFDAYTLVWPGGDLKITIDSADFDEFLWVSDPSNMETLVDTEEGTPPEVFFRPNAGAGTYTIWANAFFEGETGSYELCVSEPVATPTPTPCAAEPTPFAPQPADGASNISVDVELSWNNTSKAKVIYGADDRRDVYQVADQALLDAYDSTVILLQPSQITDNGNGTYTLANVPWTSQDGTPLCADEPFLGQPIPGFCSGFLVAPDLVVTAGHCSKSDFECSDTVFVFGFQMLDANTPVLTVPESDVYRCAGRVGQVFDPTIPKGEDWALLRLDRPVEGHDPLPIRREGTLADNQALVMIGHPNGLPAKIAGGANVRTNLDSNFFVANTDSYGGNSGSAILNADTLVVEGILVRGETDFVAFMENTPEECIRSNRCPDNGCQGEDCTRITRVSHLIPVPVQYQVYFGPCDNLQRVGTTGDTRWPLAGLVEGMAYCWRIDAVNGCVTTQGPVWSFTTASGGGGMDYDVDGNNQIDAKDLLLLIEMQMLGNNHLFGFAMDWYTMVMKGTVQPSR